MMNGQKKTTGTDIYSQLV